MTEDFVTADDTGKPVIDPDGNQVGIIADVNDETVRIEPDPDIAEDVRATLGWGEADDNYQINADALKRNPRADVAVFQLLPDKLSRN